MWQANSAPKLLIFFLTIISTGTRVITHVSLSTAVKYMDLRMLPSSPYLACQPFWPLIFLEKTERWLRRVISVPSPSSIVKQIQMPSPHPRGAQRCRAQRGAIWIFTERQSAGSGWLEGSLVTKNKLTFWGLQLKERDGKAEQVETALSSLLTSFYRPLLSKSILKSEIFLTVQVYHHIFNIKVLRDLFSFFLLYSELLPTKEVISTVFQKSQICLIIFNSYMFVRVSQKPVPFKDIMERHHFNYLKDHTTVS